MINGLSQGEQRAILAIIEYGVLSTREGEVTIYFDAQGNVRKAERRQTLRRSA